MRDNERVQMTNPRELLHLLKSASWREKQRAQLALASITEGDHIRALIRLSSQETEAVRIAICRGLGQIDSNLRYLKIFLEDKSERVRAEAEWLFQKHSSPEKVEALIEMLESRFAFARAFAAATLGTSRVAAAIRPLTRTLKDSDSHVRERAAWALKQIQARGIAALMEPLLKDEASQVRLAAAVTLGSTGRYRRWRRLTNLLEDPSSGVRVAAVWAIGRQAGDKAARILAAVLRDQPDARVRCEAARALRHATKRAVVAPLLTACAEDPDQNVRLVSGWALELVPERVKLPVLLDSIRSGKEHMRALICARLARTTSYKSHTVLLDILLHDESPHVRAVAAEALGERGDRRALPALESTLDSHPLVAYSAVVALVRLWDPRDTETLIRVLEDKTVRSPVLQQVVLRRLNDLPLGDDLKHEAFKLMVSKLSHENVNIRYLAVDALGTMGIDALLPLLRAACHDRDENVRNLAVDSVNKILSGDPRIVFDIAFGSKQRLAKDILNMLSRIQIENIHVGEVVIRALDMVSSAGEHHYGKDLSRFLKSAMRQDPEAVIEALERIQSRNSQLSLLRFIDKYCCEEGYRPAHVRSLLRLSEDSDSLLAAWAMTVLGHTEKPGVLSRLVSKAVRSRDEGVRSAARRAVAVHIA
jgi:HEAT repeat protein